MNIKNQLNTISTSALSFLSDTMIPALTEQQKRILSVALITLGVFAASYLAVKAITFIFSCFIKKENDSNSEIQDKIEKLKDRFQKTDVKKADDAAARKAAAAKAAAAKAAEDAELAEVMAAVEAAEWAEALAIAEAAEAAEAKKKAKYGPVYVYDEAAEKAKAAAAAEAALKLDNKELKLDNPKQYFLGKKGLEVAFSIDWDSDLPLFDQSFTEKWIRSVCNGEVKKNLKCTDIEKSQLFTNDIYSYIPLSDKHQTLITFLRTLCNENETLYDKYHKAFSDDNKEKIRKIMCGIMNLLQEKQGSYNYVNPGKYALVVNEIDAALHNCSNAMNTATENLFYQIHSMCQNGKDQTNGADGKGLEAALGQKVAYRLQMLRDAIFRESIQYVMDHHKQSSFYTPHAAATFNYYYGRKDLCAKLGIPPSISQSDQNYQTYALKGQDQQIIQEFNIRYTPIKMIKVIYEAVSNPEDQSIKTALFTDWLQQESQFDDEIMLEEENANGTSDYRYNPMTVVHLLKKLELINS